MRLHHVVSPASLSFACSQRTIRAMEPTECLFITKETFEQAVGKLSSILEKDKIRRFRKEWITESRKAAKVRQCMRGMCLLALAETPRCSRMHLTVLTDVPSLSLCLVRRVCPV